jgi:hypothetical protein
MLAFHTSCLIFLIYRGRRYTPEFRARLAVELVGWLRPYTTINSLGFRHDCAKLLQERGFELKIAHLVEPHLSSPPMSSTINASIPRICLKDSSSCFASPTGLWAVLKALRLELLLSSGCTSTFLSPHSLSLSVAISVNHRYDLFEV